MHLSVEEGPRRVPLWWCCGLDLWTLDGSHSLYLMGWGTIWHTASRKSIWWLSCSLAKAPHPEYTTSGCYRSNAAGSSPKGLSSRSSVALVHEKGLFNGYNWQIDASVHRKPCFGGQTKVQIWHILLHQCLKNVNQPGFWRWAVECFVTKTIVAFPVRGSAHNGVEVCQTKIPLRISPKRDWCAPDGNRTIYDYQ